MAINKYKPPKDRPEQPDPYDAMSGRLQGILIGVVIVPPLIAVAVGDVDGLVLVFSAAVGVVALLFWWSFGLNRRVSEKRLNTSIPTRLSDEEVRAELKKIRAKSEEYNSESNQ